jgi:hypothetical protein
MYALVGVYFLGLLCVLSIFINIVLLKINKETDIRERIYFEELTWIIKHLEVLEQGDIAWKLCDRLTNKLSQHIDISSLTEEQRGSILRGKYSV